MTAALKIPKYANANWPTKIWVFKPVNFAKKRYKNKKKEEPFKVEYQDHCDIRLIPSEWRWQFRKQGWRVWPDQMPEEILEFDNRMRLEYQKQHTKKTNSRQGESIMPKAKVERFKQTQKALTASVQHKKGQYDV